MDAEQIKRLQMKKEQHKLKQKENAIQQAKEDIVQNVERFNEKYRFVDECERIKIQGI